MASQLVVSQQPSSTDLNDATHYVSNTSITLSATLPPSSYQGNQAVPSSRTRMTMRDMQDSDECVSYTSGTDLMISAPALKTSPSKTSSDSCSKLMYYAAETVLDGGQPVDEVMLDYSWQQHQSDISVHSNVAPLSFSNPLYQHPNTSSQLVTEHSGSTLNGCHRPVSGHCETLPPSHSNNTRPISDDASQCYSQICLGRMPSPVAASVAEQSVLFSACRTETENVDRGTPLRRSDRLHTPPDSPQHHPAGLQCKNSATQNNVRMGVRSVQHKVQDQEKTKSEVKYVYYCKHHNIYSI